MIQATESELTARIRKAILEELPGCQAIYIHGSRTGSQARPDSDLDIAVLLPANTSLPDRLSLTSRLASHLGMEVDLVELRSASDVLRREVLSNGRCIHKAQPEEVLAWEAQALTRYGHYRREVADLLADFKATGRGFRP